MKRLAVYLNGERAGTLDEDDSGLLEFRYTPEWAGRPDAMPLSRSLPLRSEPFRGKPARPFFAGILPDEEPRQQIAAILGISARPAATTAASPASSRNTARPPRNARRRTR